MNTKNKNILFWLFLIAIAGAYIALEFSGSLIIKKLYDAQSFELLNKLSLNNTNESLQFYTERSEDITLGPIKSLLAGIFLIGICLKYLTESSTVIFGGSIFLYLFVTKFKILLFPPYGESIYGPFSDAIWLVRHSLNYIELHKQETFTSGGPLIYPLSIYPLFLAVIIKITKTSAAFLITIHTIVFIFSAIVISIFRKICLKVMTKEQAILSALLVLSMPLFQSMSELINMEMPCLLFAVLTAYYLIESRLILAGICALVSLLVKDPGIIACALVFMGCFLLAILETNVQKKLKIFFWGVLVIGLAFLKGFLRQLMLGKKQLTYNKIGLLIGWPNIYGFKPFWISLAVLFLLLVIWIVRYRKKEHAIKTFLKDEFIVILMFSMATLYFILYLNFSTLGNRYRLLLVPFFLFPLLYTTFIILQKFKWLNAFLISTIIFSFFCNYGFIFERNVPNALTTHNIFERSLEYRNDLILYMKLAKQIETDYSDYTIGAPLLVAESLNFNEIGYVKRSLPVIVYGMKANHEGLKDFEGIDNLDLRKTIWVGTYNDRIINEIEFPIGPHDKIMNEITSADKKIYIFKGGFAIDKMLKTLQYLDLHRKGRL